MATSITTNLSDADEAILNRLTAEYNAAVPPPDPLTPVQFFREHIRGWIQSQASRLFDRDQTGMRAAYTRATRTEQAQIDAILDRHR